AVAAALITLPSGSNLLAVRYPNATTCEFGYSVLGPADRRGSRAVTGRFLCAQDFEVVRRDRDGGWPDVRLTGFVRCGRDDRGMRINCWDAVFRWDGSDWQYQRRAEYRSDGIWRVGPVTPGEPQPSHAQHVPYEEVKRLFDLYREP